MTKRCGLLAPVLTNWVSLYRLWEAGTAYGAVVAQSRNADLAAWMAEHRMSAGELAGAVNQAVGELTGRPGATSERTVFRWLSGENRWPQERQRRALERVTGLSATALGFIPRGRQESVAPVSEKDVEVRRRRFCSVATSVLRQ
ncbi:hypothetical protein ACFYOV_33145 [Streptomyces sp. NPDC005931]|uniref:hypothetical protein n=1 Tax=Streptomyces sp. NPDC005931 TaxID=3364737 RepID=UPI0036B96AD0